MIVVARQQSNLATHDLAQGPPQPDITTPALVLAKVPRHQHKIGVHGAANLKSSLKVSKGRQSPHQPLISGQQVWITELKNPHRSLGWTASHCSSALDP